MLKSFLTSATVGFALLASASTASVAQQRTQVTVYTALDADQLPPYKQSIEAAVPDVEVVWVRDSTGVITARLLAEKDNPRADIVLSLAATSLLLFEKQGMLDTYKPAGADALKPAFRDAVGDYTWTGMDAYLAVVCHNNPEAQKANTPVVKSWQDLTNPAFKGRIVMPHPASSGTGYLQVAAWMQIMGEQAAWAYMDKLHDNIAVYTHSGSAPCVQAARGERVIGIGADMRGAREKTQGAPIDLIVPTEGVGWEMEATAVIKGSKNIAAARKVADWVTTKAANEVYAKSYAVVAHPDVKAAPANYPTNAEPSMVKNDFAWMAENRERILAEWTKRYEGKAAPR